MEVACRPKFKRFFSPDNIEAIIETISEYAQFIEVQTVTTICLDFKDNFLLSLAKDGEADFLLTGDRDLLELKQFDNTVITTITDFFNNPLK